MPRQVRGEFIPHLRFGAACCLLVAMASVSQAEDHAVANGWKFVSPRDEIRPAFAYQAKGGPHGTESLVIEADEREGLFGWWEKTFEIEGGKFYRFAAVRKADGIEVPRRTAVARVSWRDDEGRAVLHDEPAWASYRPGQRPRSEPEFPADQGTDEHGWTTVAGVYHAPSAATKAIDILCTTWLY